MFTEYLSKTGVRAATDRTDDSALPDNIAPWSKVGAATGLTYAETTIIKREGFVIREQGNA